MDKRYEKLFNLNPAAIVLVDQNGAIKETNPSAKSLFDSIRIHDIEFYALLSADIKQRIRNNEQIKNFEMTIHNGDKRLDVLIDGDYLMVEYQPYIILILRDVTRQKENEREITFLAYHDPLTRLPNRRYFYDKLETAIDDARVNGDRLAVVLIDLDYFKEINDKYGHKAGDEVLVQVAKIIRRTINGQGTAARLGGDEFVFFLHSVPSVRMVQDTITKLQSELAQAKLSHKEEPVRLGLSIGASFYPEHGEDRDTLLNHADKAMYRVKRKGRNAYHLLSGEAKP
jgi:diguanylate cyclase (GGDEF)-like protein